jgi:hypothetical protein
MGVAFVLPDTQIKPGVPTDHLRWAGQYLVDHFKGVDDVTVIHLGDHWDMPSLSSYDKGKMGMEGRRYVEDVKAGNDALAAFDKPLNDYNARKQSLSKRQWRPRKVLLRGNHEYRINRAVENDAQLDGLLSEDALESPGWEVYPFLQPVDIDGVVYAHYFANPMTGRPYGGMVATRLKNIGHSFTMGHQQTYDHAVRYVRGKPQIGLVAGAFYLHDEDYKGFQGNDHFRGIIVKHQVEDGAYDIMQVSIDYLCRRYEGKPVAVWLRENGYAHYSLAKD